MALIQVSELLLFTHIYIYIYRDIYLLYICVFQHVLLVGLNTLQVLSPRSHMFIMFFPAPLQPSRLRMLDASWY